MKSLITSIYKTLWWILSSLLLYLSFPPNGIPFLGLFALIPSIYRSYKDGYIKVILDSFIFSIIFWILSVDWFSSFHPFALIAIILPLYLFTMLPFVILSSISKNFNEDGIILFPFLWVMMETVRLNGFWSFPMILLGHTQYHFSLSDNIVFSSLNGAIPSIAQSFGILGVSLSVALFNSSFLIIFLKIQNKKLKQENLKLSNILLLTVTIIAIYSTLIILTKPYLINLSILSLALIVMLLLTILLIEKSNFLNSINFYFTSLKAFYPIVLVVTIFTYGLTIYLDTKKTYDNFNGNIVKFGLLQPNFSPWDKILARDFGKLEEVTKLYQDAGKFADIVVGCESILRDPVNVYYNYGDRFGIEAMNIPKKVGKPVILTYPHKESFLTNTFIKRNGKLFRVIQEISKYYNSAIFFDSEGKIIARYDKVHTVPFGEWTPFAEYIPGLRETINSIVGGELHPGKEFTVVSIKVKPSVVVNLAPIICFEDLYPYITKKLRIIGADVLVNMTNDGWARSVKSQWQHLIGAMFRAIETGIPLIRATNTGRTALILPYGKIISNINDFEKGFMIAELKIAKVPTFFTTYGEYLIIAIILITNAFIPIYTILKTVKNLKTKT